MRDTIATPNQPRYDSFMDQYRDGNTMTSYDLNNGTIHVWIVRSKTLEVLAEGIFADSGLAKQFMVEMNTAMEKIRKSRSNVTEGGVHGTPEPEEQIVVWSWDVFMIAPGGDQAKRLGVSQFVT